MSTEGDSGEARGRRPNRALGRLVPPLRFVVVALVVALVAGLVACVAVVASAYFAPLPERLGLEDSTVVEYRDGTPAHVFLSPDEKWRIGRPSAEIDAGYVAALVALEDKRFYYHPGVDPLAIVRAAAGNLRRGEVESGASTITMQLARLLEPRPRTLRSKLVEAWRAVQLEVHLSKDEILEAYLRFVPFGRNVEGLEAASLAYFGHTAQHLSREEIAVLLAVPQSPNTRYPSPRNAARLTAARDGIAARLQRAGLWEAAGDGGVGEGVGGSGRVPEALRPFPREMPHAAYWLRATRTRSLRVRTTIDANTQRIAEGALARHADEARGLGIDNAAVVVADHESGEVRALVGNFTFGDGAGSHIAAFDIARSPGSLLKPFIYAAAIDRGLALPEYLVEDTPFERGAYRPQNYSGTYMGLVTLGEALSLSLNIPFVRLLEEVGVENFVGQLRHMGARHLRDEPGYYGLSLAVGASEMTALEVAGLFATLARGGTYRPLEVLAGAGPGEGLEVYSEEAAWLTSRTLGRRDRPDFPARRQAGQTPVQLRWKTGTSFGHRDAWTAGYLGAHTAVVWFGNADNRSNAALVGSERAAPVLFDVLEAVEGTGRSELARAGVASARPAGIARVEVCEYSGHLPTPACERTRHVDAPRRSVPTRRCPYHVRHDVDDETGLLLTPMCRGGRGYHRRSFVVWPPGVRRWLADELAQGGQLPGFAPGCEPAKTGAAAGGGGRAVSRAPSIVSPPDGQALVLMPGLSAERQRIALEADGASANVRLSWFVAGEFLGTTGDGEALWWTPRPGRHEVVVIDEAGRSARRVLEVREAGGHGRL